MLNSRNIRSEPTIAYFAKDRGTWQGAGARHLQLEGELDRRDFARLLQGRMPYSDELIFDPRVKRAGIDCTFSAPKSVSIAALIYRDGAAVAAHEIAVRQTLDFIEERYANVKVKGELKSSQNLIIAKFLHAENRNQDPHLHTHCILVNASFYQDKWRALRNDAIYFNNSSIGLVYQQNLAFELKKHNYSISFTDKGYVELPDIDLGLVEKLSTRRNEIVKASRSSNWQDRQLALLRTRKPKAAPNYNPPAASDRSGEANVPLSSIDPEIINSAFLECVNKYFRFDREKLETIVLRNARQIYDLSALFALTKEYSSLQQIVASSLWQEREKILQKAITSPLNPLMTRIEPGVDPVTATLTTPNRYVVWESRSDRLKREYLARLCRTMPREIEILDYRNPNWENSKARLWIAMRAERLLADRLTEIIRLSALKDTRVLFVSRNVPSQLKHLQSGMLSLQLTNSALEVRPDRIMSRNVNANSRQKL